MRKVYITSLKVKQYIKEMVEVMEFDDLEKSTKDKITNLAIYLNDDVERNGNITDYDTKDNILFYEKVLLEMASNKQEYTNHQKTFEDTNSEVIEATNKSLEYKCRLNILENKSEAILRFLEIHPSVSSIQQVGHIISFESSFGYKTLAYEIANIIDTFEIKVYGVENKQFKFKNKKVLYNEDADNHCFA